jgi:hypothetical protein
MASELNWSTQRCAIRYAITGIAGRCCSAWDTTAVMNLIEKPEIGRIVSSGRSGACSRTRPKQPLDLTMYCISDGAEKVSVGCRCIAGDCLLHQLVSCK